MSKNMNREFLYDADKAETMKDLLENLSLYLNEIEKIINMAPGEADEEEKQYRLRILEQRIYCMNEVFQLVSGKYGRGNTTLS